MEPIPSRIDSTFRFVLLAARRAEQLMRGARPKIETQNLKPTYVALKEISADVVEWEYGPPPAPPAETYSTDSDSEPSLG